MKKNVKKVDDSIQNCSFLEINYLIVEVHPFPNLFNKEIDQEFLYNPRVVYNLNDFSETDKYIVIPSDIINPCPSCAALQCVSSLLGVYKNIHKIVYVYDLDGDIVDEFDLDQMIKNDDEEEDENDDTVKTEPKTHRLH